jgi:riboflavin kinase/FMN adenylyltransferase
VFRSLGVGMCVILKFDSELAAMTADHFLEDILRARLRAEHVVVGHDFAMGHDRVGNTRWLSERIDTTVVPPYEIDGRRVSSSAIRNAVISGDMPEAAQLLGRPFAMSGVVISGQKLGRKLGYPTANLARSREQVVPKYGVYAGYADTPLGRYRAAMSVGLRPTVDGKSRTIEAFLLDFPGDSIYGSGVEFHMVRRLRDEIAFAGLEELKTQMALDVIETAKLPLS